MPELFGVEPDDVAGLPPLDFVRLINHIVRNELRLQNIVADLDLSLRIDDPDGGIDGRISWKHGPERTLHLPARLNGFQAKAGARQGRAEVKAEIQTRDGSALKRRVGELLREGGTYVLFSAADMTFDQKQERIDAMQEAAVTHLGRRASFHIIAAEEIAEWSAQDLWARAFLIQSAGRAQPDLLLTYEEWERQLSVNGALGEYVWTSDASIVADALRTALATPGTTYRIDGAPGLGKTRLALEVLRALTSGGRGVVYFDTRVPGSDRDLVRALPNWRRNAVRGILVVDDCDLRLHQQIVQQIAGTGISAVTIDYRHSSGSNVTLRPVADDTIAEIVKRHPNKPPQFSEHRIVAYAQGWPLMAILVLTALANGDQAVADLEDDELTRRLTEISGKPDAVSVLRVLALFDHVGFDHEVSDEWETVRAELLPDVSRARFYEIVQDYQRRGLVASIGRYWRVTPPPLAIRMTRDWLDAALPENQQKLFSDLPSALGFALARRFDDLGASTVAVNLARRLLAVGARFGGLDGITGPVNAEVFRALAEVEPAGAAKALGRIILPLDDNALNQIDEDRGRQTLVFAAEGVAFHREHFAVACRVLFALARNENSTYGNNASGTLTKLFSVVGSQTEAPLYERLPLLDEFLARDDVKWIALAGQILTRILSRDGGHGRVGPESQGGRPPLVEFQPGTWGEIFAYWKEAIDRVIGLSAKGEHGVATARKVFVEAIRVLANYKRYDELERAARALGEVPWAQAEEQLREALRYEMAAAPTEERARIEALIDMLQPVGLDERVRALLVDSARDTELRDDEIVDHAEARARTFAHQTLATGEFRHVFTLLSTGDSQHGYAYANEIGQITDDLAGVLDVAVSAFASADEPRSAAVLIGVVNVAAQRAPELREATLTRIASDANLAPALALVAVHPQANDNDARRLIDGYSAAKLPEPPALAFAGQRFSNVAEPLIRDLATALVDRGFFAGALSLLLSGVSREDHYDEILSRVLLECDIVFYPLPGFYDWSALDVLRRLVKSGNARLAEAAANRMIDLAVSKEVSFQQKRRVEDVWPALLEGARDMVWDVICARYRNLDARERYMMLWEFEYFIPGTSEHKWALDVIPLDKLVAFAAQYPEDAPACIARYAPALHNDGGELHPTAHMLALLEHFGDRVDVLSNLEARMTSFMSIGPRANYFQARLDAVNRIPTYGRATITEWKETFRADLTAEHGSARVRDDEFEGGIYGPF